MLYLNPFVAQFDVICQATGEACIAQQASMPRFVDTFANQQFDANGQPIFPAQAVQLDGSGQPICPGNCAQFAPQPIPAGGDFWPKSVAVYLVLAAIGIVAAAQSISPTRRWHPKARSGRSTEPAVAGEVAAEAAGDD